MSIFDTINQKYGKHAIRLAAQGYSKSWAMRAEMKSPAYTDGLKSLALPFIN